MPKVSEAHLSRRRAQILDAARRCFAANGFHATSMQDVLREAGLSAGAVYRYFPSKHALIREIAAGAIGKLGEEIARIVAGDPQPTLLGSVDRLLIAIEPFIDFELRLAVQVWGEALRDPEVKAMVAEIYAGPQQMAVDLAGRLRTAGALPPAADVGAVGRVIFAVALGYVLQRLLIGEVDRPQMLRGLAALAGR